MILQERCQKMKCKNHIQVQRAHWIRGKAGEQVDIGGPCTLGLVVELTASSMDF